MSTIRATIAYIYWAQVFVPLLMGEIFRGAAANWVTVACQNADRRFGLGGAVFCATIYFTFCYALVTIRITLFGWFFQRRTLLAGETWQGGCPS